MTDKLRCWIVPEIDDNELLAIMNNLLVSLPDGATVLDEEGHFLCLFGGRKDLEFLPGEFVLGKTVSDFSTPQRAGKFMQMMKLALETNSKQSFEAEVVVQGKNKLIQLSFFPLHYMFQGQKLVGMYISDHTEYHAIASKLDLAYRFAQQNSVFSMIFNGKNEPEQMIRELTNYGMNCEGSYCCYYFLMDRKNRVDQSIHTPYFHSVVIEYFMKKGIQWAWSDDHGFYILIPTTDQTQDQAYGDSLFQELRMIVPYFEVFLGVSCCSPNDPTQLTELPRNAFQAAIVAGINRSDVSHYNGIGLYQFAFQLVENGGHVRFIKEALGSLVDFDSTHNVKLIDTMESLLEYQNIKVVANKLGLHHNTVIWRKQKIMHLLNNNLDDFTANATLAVAAKAWRIAKYLNK